VFVLALSTFMQATLRWRSPRPGVVLSDAELGAIAQPVHFVWGEGDIYGSPSIGRRTADILPHATLEVRPGGHFPQLDDPETCAKSILRVLGPS
jgi:pimeloyl-ACP methyl ester carboxylesterase